FRVAESGLFLSYSAELHSGAGFELHGTRNDFSRRMRNNSSRSSSPTANVYFPDRNSPVEHRPCLARRAEEFKARPGRFPRPASDEARARQVYAAFEPHVRNRVHRGILRNFGFAVPATSRFPRLP